jgi:hypothetical protein
MRAAVGREPLHRPRPRSRLGFLAGTALVLSTFLPAAGSHAAVIAEAAGVIPAATGELGGTRVTILQGAQLEEGQLIVTDAGGEVQITFVDNTRMVIGPNSSLQIERFLMRNDGTFSSFAVNALGGTFRFITGNSPSDAYRVTTPAGTISVRGTKWDLTVQLIITAGNLPFYIANAIVYLGSIIMCPIGIADCVILRDHCDLGTMTANAPATIMAALMARERFANQVFRYALPEFQDALFLANQIEEAEDCADEEPGDSGAPAGEGGGGGGGGANTPPEGPRPNCPPQDKAGPPQKFGAYWNYETKGSGEGPPSPCDYSYDY